MTKKQTDLMTLHVAYWDYKDDKNLAMMQFVRGMIDIETYNQELDLIDHKMNASQFRYIDKYRIKDRTLATKEFQLTPDDLSKINYN